MKACEQKRSSSVPDWLGGSGFWDFPLGGVGGHNDDGNGDGRVALNHVVGAFESAEKLTPVHGKVPESGKERKVVDVEEEKEGFRPQSAELSREAFPSISASLVAEAKLSDLEFQLSREVINLDVVRNIAKSGIPNGSRLRATTWKLLLGYLPIHRDLWETELAENRLKYASLKAELLLRPSEFRRQEEARNSGQQRLETDTDTDGPLKRHEIVDGDHPLSNGKASAWHKYFQDTETAEQINRDLLRTHPDMSFFSGGSSFSHENQEAMRNILLLFAKMNPVICYVQGMNEVLAPIYYVFKTDPDVQGSSNAEADSFACFVRLLSDSVDHFCQQLDNSSVGIHSTLSRLTELLKAHDEELWRHLVIINKVNPQYYAFRWITLLLTQEFSFDPILRIWDSLLGDPCGVQDMLLRVCVAMLLCSRGKLLRGDFISNMKLLLHYPKIDIDYLLKIADEIDTSV